MSGKVDWFILTEPWKWHTQVFLNVGVSASVFLSTIPFWRRSTAAYRQQVDHFFERMTTPVDFEREVGAGNDTDQFRIIGLFSALLGGGISLLALLPNPWTGRLCFLFVGGFSLLLGLLFLRKSRSA